jgi:hypothetical protein
MRGMLDRRRVRLGIALAGALLLLASPAFAATWTTTTTPNATPFDNVLWGVDALSPSSAWAVGSADTGTVPTRRPIALRWDGVRWSSVASPLPPGGGELRDADAVSATTAFAVGFSNSSNGFNTLVERWNGTAWSILPSPNVAGAAQNTLLGVRAFSATDAWAVGSHNVPGTLRFSTLVERWNGTTWSIVPSPDPDPFESQLVDVDGVSSSDLWAVGSRRNSPDGVSQPIVLHFDGSSWSIVSVPGGVDATLQSVVARASNDVWAVGSEFSQSLFWHVPFVLHWNGTVWSKVAIPSPGPQGGRLYGVVALSATNVYVVGQTSASGAIPSLVMHWNGSQWNVESIRSRSSVAPLWDVSSASPGTVFAVGSSASVRGGVVTPTRTFVLRSGNA